MDAQISNPTTSKIPREAIIYIPGLNFVVNQSLDNITRQIADALERASKKSSASFSLEAANYKATYRETRTFNYRTILRNENGKPTRAMDVYEMDYLPSFTQDYENKHPVTLLLRMFLVLILNIPLLIHLAPKNEKIKNENRRKPKTPGVTAKTFKEKFQLLFASLVVGVIVAYMAILVLAIVELVRTLPQFQSLEQSAQIPIQQPDLATTPAPSQATSTNSTLPRPLFVLIPQLVVVVVALAELAWPKLTDNLRQGIQHSAIHFMSVVDYFSVNTRQKDIEGHFLALLDCLGETKETAYSHIYLVTYSFGSMVALDGLFPTASNPSERVKLIDGLVTIGNPFDLFRMFWPKYFQKRSEIKGKELMWLNVYSPIDILGSNFRDNGDVAEADLELIKTIGLTAANAPINIPYPPNISYNDYNILQLFTLIGLTSHASYFPSVATGGTTCFDEFIPQLLKDTGWLD